MPKIRQLLVLAVASTVSLAILGGPAQAQPAPRAYRIAVLNEAWGANHPAVEGLRDGMRELGFVEGRDVSYAIHFTRGVPGATAAAAAEIVSDGVDLIFTSNEAATLAAKKATQRIPVVFTLIGDPVATGLVSSLAHPGGNLTGVSSRGPELAPKRLELLKTLAPALRRVWFIHYANDVTDSAVFASLEAVAPKLGLQLVARPVRDAAGWAAIQKDIRPGDGLLAPTSGTLDIPAAIIEAARAANAPSAFPAAVWVGHGALVSYGPDFRAQGAQAARLVARILRGTKPQDLPVEGADRIDLAIDLNVARQLKLTVPPKILYRANVVRQ